MIYLYIYIKYIYIYILHIHIYTTYTYIHIYIYIYNIYTAYILQHKCAMKRARKVFNVHGEVYFKQKQKLSITFTGNTPPQKAVP